MDRLKGKTAVITGGGSGIGLASARLFAAEGAFVFVAGRRQAALDAAVEELGPKVRGIQTDVSKPEELDRLYEVVKKEKGHIDVLLANAGVGAFAPLADITVEHYRHAFDINVQGTLFTVQRALPLLRSGSSIILTGSTVGVMGTTAMSVYSASKAAVRNFARSWAQDFRGTGIRVNVLSPGPTKTDKLVELLNPEIMEGFATAVPLGRLGDPAEAAAAAVFLASDESSFMTGSELFVDGGLAQI